ncbi:MAG: hypothetical protein K6G01_08555 [Eubacterium sp.]|nr:hypothetical protein [Eubacterium sp.]
MGRNEFQFMRFSQAIINSILCVQPDMKPVCDELNTEMIKLTSRVFPVVPERIEHIFNSIFEGDRAACDALSEVIVLRLFPKLGEYLRFATGHACTVRNAYLISGNTSPTFSEMKKTFDYLCRVFEGNRNVMPFFDAEFHMDDRFIEYLCGSDIPSHDFMTYGTILRARMHYPAYDMPLHSLSLSKEMAHRDHIWLIGEFPFFETLKASCHHLEYDTVYIDLQKIKPEEVQDKMEEIFRELFFHCAYLAIDGLDDTRNGHLYPYIQSAVKDGLPLVIHTTERNSLLAMTETYFRVIEI